MNTLLQDLRFGLRMLVKNPSFTAVVVITLALGIGANAAVFAIVKAVLFEKLPVSEPDRIVAITSNNLTKKQPQLGASYLDYQDWRAQVKSFDALGIVQPGQMNLTDPGLPTDSFPGGRVSANTFSVVGAKPLMGRDFLPNEDQGAGANVAILGYKLWKSRYGGDSNILGRVVNINEVPSTVVGVMREGMEFPYNQEVWTPLFATSSASSLTRREARGLVVYGRLRENVTMAEAQSEMDVIATRLQQSYPQLDKGIGARVMPYTEFFFSGPVRLLFFAMLGAVAFVLLIACANVANLLLARSITRTREVSIRVAMGAGRGRVVRQLLIESLLFAILGSAIGFLVTLWGVRAFQAALPGDIQLPYWMSFATDYRVIFYLIAICVTTSILFGLAPALHTSKVDLNHALKEGARGSTSGRARVLSRALVVGEVSLALVLLIGAGLMVRSFFRLYAMSSGLENDKVLTMRLFFSGGKYLVPAPRVAVLERLEPELANTPGVESIALASGMPLDWVVQWHFDLEGQQPPADPNDRPAVAGVEISSQYFTLLGVPLLRGRFFSDTDGKQGEKVAIVNQRFAAKYWGGQDPVGKRIGIVRDNQPQQQWVTVVGEVPDIKQNSGFNSNQGEMDPVIYVPYLQDQEARGFVIFARTKGDPLALAVPLRNAVQKVNNMPVSQVMTLPESLARMRWFVRLFGVLFVIFAAIGVALAAIGIYAVMAYSVGQRTQEIGIRMALGAQKRRILKLVLGQGLVLAAIGVVIGIAGSVLVTRVMTGFLVGVTPTDPATFATVAILLAFVAAVACYIPAWRATKVDPMLALRAE